MISSFAAFDSILYSEILRVIDSLQLTAKYKVATPVDWQVYLKIIYIFICYFIQCQFFPFILFCHVLAWSKGYGCPFC